MEREKRIQLVRDNLKNAELDVEIELIPVTYHEFMKLLTFQSIEPWDQEIYNCVDNTADRLAADCIDVDFKGEGLEDLSLYITFRRDTDPPNGKHKSDNEAQLSGQESNVGLTPQSEKQKQ